MQPKGFLVFSVIVLGSGAPERLPHEMAPSAKDGAPITQPNIVCGREALRNSEEWTALRKRGTFGAAVTVQQRGKG